MRNILIASLLFLSACTKVTITNLTTTNMVYYVSSSYTGTVSNGSQAAPWKSLSVLQTKMSTLLPGDQVLFKRGDAFTGTLSVTKSGSSVAPITFGAYGTGVNPKFIGTGATITQLFYVYNNSYIVFDSLYITDSSISTTDRAVLSKIQRGFVLDGTSSRITIKNTKIELVGVGVFFSGTGGYSTMQGCDVGNLRMVVSDTKLDNDYGANAAVVSSSNNQIINNNFHDCYAKSIDYTYDGGAVEMFAPSNKIVENNFIAYNVFTQCQGSCEIGGYTGSTIRNLTFAYNKFINNGSGILIQNSGSFTTVPQNINIYNNVFIENTANVFGFASALIRFRAKPTTPNILFIKNNVIQISVALNVGKLNTDGTKQLDGTHCIHTNNVFKLSGGSVLNFTPSTAETSTSGTIFTSTSGNPLLWNYRPSTGSILIDAGANVGLIKDFSGASIVNAPNIGILE